MRYHAGALVTPFLTHRTWTRREWGAFVAGPLIAGPFSGRGGRAAVAIGVQSYSFRDRPLDQAIAAMKEIGLAGCELWQDHIETKDRVASANRGGGRDALRAWRLQVPLDLFREIRKQFDAAGIVLTAYNLSMVDDFTDEEIDRGFQMAKALGVDTITSSSKVTTVKRIDAAAQRHGIKVGFHNHSDIKPNEFATPDDFDAALTGTSSLMAINLDIGHFTAANFDALAYLEQHHDRIVSLHIKDRRRNQGAIVPFGEGDAPIVPVLRRVRDRGWPMALNIEYEYEGADTIREVRRCLEYCRKALS
jgi:sugar phosphate isomerase/epimerase